MSFLLLTFFVILTLLGFQGLVPVRSQLKQKRSLNIIQYVLIGLPCLFEHTALKSPHRSPSSKYVIALHDIHILHTDIYTRMYVLNICT